jgi:L-threonylcarbamoyladenylate synthase
MNEVVAAIRAGEPVVLPTDTVYGLCADASREDPVRRLLELKGRPGTQPVALLAAELEPLLEAIPELRGASAAIAGALLPGSYTLVVPNPARRFAWLTGARPETIGVRVPALPAAAREVVDAVGFVAATSANLHGGADPARVADVPESIRAVVAAIVDGGDLPGTPSTVIDLTDSEPRILREGAVRAEEALARIGRALPTGTAT